MKKLHYVTILLCAIVLAGCGNNQGTTAKSPQGNEPVQQTDDSNSAAANTENGDKEAENSQNSNEGIDVVTQYCPTEFFSLNDNLIVVKRGEDTNLFGAIDTDGNVIIDPQYDDMRISVVNGTKYLAANMEGKFGVLNLDGSEKIAFEYDKIVSAGDIGWLAVKDGVQFLLHEDGSIDKQLTGRYSSVVDNKYLEPSVGYHYEDYADMDDTHGSMIICGTACDLDENLIIKVKDQQNETDQFKLLGYDDLVVFQKISYIDDNNGFQHLRVMNFNGDNVIDIATSRDEVYEVDKEKHEFIVEISFPDTMSSYTYEERAADGGCIGTDLEEGYYIFNTDTREFTPYPTPYYRSGFKVEETGDFSRVLGQGGTDLFGERFKTVNQLGNGLFCLENIDGQWGMGTITGKIIIPFGETDSSGNYNGNTFISGIDDIDESYIWLISKRNDGAYELAAVKK